MKLALFFLRHFNDIDHIVPVIDAWIKIPNFKAEVILYPNLSGHQVLYNRLDLRHDFRIQYIAQLPQVRVHHLHDFIPIDHNPHDRATLWRDAADNAFSLLCPPKVPTVVVFDWEYEDFAKYVTYIAKQRGFGRASICHGGGSVVHDCSIHNIDDLGGNYEETQFEGPANLKEMYDVHFHPNELLIGRSRPENMEIAVAPGCPRYCKDWMKTVDGILPHFSSTLPPGRTNVAMFLRSWCYPIFWDEVARTVKMIASFPEMRLVIQHHTRENDFLENLDSNYTLLNQVIDQHPDNVQVVGFEAQAGSIVRWADVILDLCSSVAVEAVQLGKPVLEMEYLHALHSTVAEYLPVTAMHYRDQLFRWLKAFSENPQTPFYNEAEREAFILEMIEGRTGNVLSRYVQMLADIAGP